jgi:hypothetical protein
MKLMPAAVVASLNVIGAGVAAMGTRTTAVTMATAAARAPAIFMT